MTDDLASDFAAAASRSAGRPPGGGLADDFAAAAAAPGSTEAAQPAQPSGSASDRFLSNLWNMVNPVTMAKGIYQAATNPSQVSLGVARAALEQAKKSGEILGELPDAYKTGGVKGAFLKYLEAGGHSVAATLPLLGPPAAEAGEQIGSGDIAGGMGKATGMIAPIVALPAAGALVSKVAAKVAAPFSASVDAEAAAAAARQGVTLPASALSTSKVVPLIEATAAKGIFGGAVSERVTNAMAQTNNAADRIVAGAGMAGADPELAGRLLSEGVGDFIDHFHATKQALYEDARIPKQGLPVVPQRTIDLLDSAIAQKTVAQSPDLGTFQKMRESLTGPSAKPIRVRGGGDTFDVDPQTMQVIPRGTAAQFVPRRGGAVGSPAGPNPIEVSDLRSIQKEWNARFSPPSFDPVVTGNKGLLEKLQATLGDELDEKLSDLNPELGAKLRAANDYFGDTVGKLNVTVGKTVNKLAESPDLLAKSLVNPKMSVANIPRLEQVAGPEAMDAVRGSVVSDLIQKARNPASGDFTPEGLARGMATWGEPKLRALLAPDQYAALSDLSTLTKAMGRASKVAEGSQTAFLNRIQAETLGFFVNPPVALKVLASDAFLSRLVGSSAGQRWLTTGFGPRATEAISRSLPPGAGAALGGIDDAAIAASRAAQQGGPQQ